MFSAIVSRRDGGQWRSILPFIRPDDGLLQIKMIEKKFGDFPLSALADPCTRSIFKVRSAIGKARDQAELISRAGRLTSDGLQSRGSFWTVGRAYLT